ncbi:SPARC-like protein 1 [Ctenodactylus gundi]
MKTGLFFLYILGTATAIPTNARFLSDHPKPTVEALETPESTEIPILRVECAEDEEVAMSIENQPNRMAEKLSALRSEGGNHDQSAEQNQTHSHELGLKAQEEGDSHLSVNLEYSPTESTLDPKEDGSEGQKKTLPENIDFPASGSGSPVDSSQQENITKGEDQEQPILDSQHQLNKSNAHSQDLKDEGSREYNPNIPTGEGDEKDLEEFGTSDDSQAMEKELPEVHTNSTQEEDFDQPADIVGGSNQPTQVSKVQKKELEQGDQDQEDDSSHTKVEEGNASDVSKHVQDTAWQSQEGKMGLRVVGIHENTGEKTVSEAVPTESTDDSHVTPRNHGANADEGNDDLRHSASDDDFIPSQDFIEAEKAQSNMYHLKSEEEREKLHKKENVDASQPGDHQGVRKAENPPNEEEASSSGGTRGRDAVLESCVSFQCKRGHVCKAETQGQPHCVCQDPMTCPPAKPLDQACGTDNQTYASSCHLFATKCRLEGTKKGHQLQLDYFGACKAIPACTDFEVTQFPLRMRDWLKNILMQLYEHNPKHTGYLNEKQRTKVKKIYLDEKRLLAGDHSIELLLRDFKKNYHMYVYPVHWQFNELDRHPMDRILTHSELATLRASLVPMEHCITRFFEECDPNKDKHITLKEWGHCFGIKEEDIDENLLF